MRVLEGKTAEKKSYSCSHICDHGVYNRNRILCLLYTTIKTLLFGDKLYKSPGLLSSYWPTALTTRLHCDTLVMKKHGHIFQSFYFIGLDPTVNSHVCRCKKTQISTRRVGLSAHTDVNDNMAITTTLRSVQVKVSQRFSTITGDWLGDSLSDMTTGTHVAPQAKKHARNISPTGIFSVERHWTSHLLLFTAKPLQVHDCYCE